MHRNLVRRLRKGNFLNEPVKRGACTALPLCVLYAVLALFHGSAPGLSQIVQIIIDVVEVFVGADLLFLSLRATRPEMGVFSEQRLAIIIGAVVIVCVALTSLVRIIAAA